jgi:hypothetical protein
MAVARLKEAVSAGESWATLWYLNRVWPTEDKSPLGPTTVEIVYHDRLLPERTIEGSSERED